MYFVIYETFYDHMRLLNEWYGGLVINKITKIPSPMNVRTLYESLLHPIKLNA